MNLAPADNPAVESKRYHHGALREALLSAAESLIDERGIEGFSVRAAARRAGVSPAAPGYHFKGSKGLLTALAAAAFERFGVALEQASQSSDLNERLKLQAVAYLRFALAERAKFKLMWRIDLIDRGSPEYSSAIQRATGVLMNARRDKAPLVSEDEPFRDVETRVARLKDPALHSAVAVWALVHGFSMLALNGVFGDVDDTEPGPEGLLTALLDKLLI